MKNIHSKFLCIFLSIALNVIAEEKQSPRDIRQEIETACKELQKRMHIIPEERKNFESLNKKDLEIIDNIYKQELLQRAERINLLLELAGAYQEQSRLKDLVVETIDSFSKLHEGQRTEMMQVVENAMKETSSQIQKTLQEESAHLEAHGHSKNSENNFIITKIAPDGKILKFSIAVTIE